VYPRENRALKDLVVARGRARGADVWALRDVSFAVEPGSAVGLVGRNGSGKSTLLRLLSGIIKPTSGRADVGGRVGSLLELGAGFHPDLTGRENVFLNGSILGMSKKEITRKFDEIVEFSGVEQFIDQPVKNYSSGMYVRLGFSVAINVDPDVLVVDEVLAVGDQEFQDKCRQKFQDFKEAGKTVILVSHAMGSVQEMCDHAAWLRRGELVTVGEAEPTIKAYMDSLHRGAA
jgi:ABC-2 type transport system ATP-binding protein